MSSINTAVALTNGTHISYFLNSVLKVLSIQTIFSISNRNIYLQDTSRNNYFPNNQDEFLNIDEKILTVQPFAGQIKLETIIINSTDSRFLWNLGDFYDYDYLLTGYNGIYKIMRRSLIKFDNLKSLDGKKIVKAYLRLFGRVRESTCNSSPREVFVHRVEQNYGNILKYTEMPSFNPKPEASIIVGETNEEIFSIDITSLVNGWTDQIYKNYGVLLKQNDPYEGESGKNFYRSSKPPQLIVLCLPN